MPEGRLTKWQPLSEGSLGLNTAYLKSPYIMLFDYMESNDVAAIRNLLQKDPEQQNEIINAAFLDACRIGKRKLAREFLNNVNPNVRNADDITALMLCSVHVDFSRRATMHDVINHLLEQGCDPNLVDASGRTALHWAALHANEEAVRILIKAGVNVNTHDRSGHTPLLLAASNVHGASAVHQLVHAGAEPMRCNLRGENALHIAVSTGLAMVTAKLLPFCLDLNATDVYGNTALHLACRRGDYDIVHMLLKSESPTKKINISIRPLSPNEFTPLELACCYKHWDVARLLLSRPDCHVDVPYANKNSSAATSLAMSSVSNDSNLRRRLLPPMGRSTPLKRPKPQATASRPAMSPRESNSDPHLFATDSSAPVKDEEAPLFEPPVNALGFAISHKNEEIVSAILKAKGCLDYPRSQRYRTHPLYLCVKENAPEIFQQLSIYYDNRCCGRCYSLDVKDDSHCSRLPSHYAHLLNLSCSLGHTAMIRVLLQLGFNPMKPCSMPDFPCDVPPFSHFFLERKPATNLSDLWQLCKDDERVHQAVWHLPHLMQLFSLPLSRCLHRNSVLQLLDNWSHMSHHSTSAETSHKLYFQLVQHFLIYLLNSHESSFDLKYLERIPARLIKKALSSSEVLQATLTPEKPPNSLAFWLPIICMADLRPGRNTTGLSLSISTQLINRLWMSGHLETIAVLCALGGMRVKSVQELIEFSGMCLETSKVMPSEEGQESLLRQRCTTGVEKRTHEDTKRLLKVIRSSHMTPQPLYTQCLLVVRANLAPSFLLYSKEKSQELTSLQLPQDVEKAIFFASHDPKIAKRKSNIEGFFTLLKQIHFQVA